MADGARGEGGAVVSDTKLQRAMDLIRVVKWGDRWALVLRPVAPGYFDDMPLGFCDSAPHARLARFALASEIERMMRSDR